MKLTVFLPMAFAASPAFAHVAPASHAHPHGDWSLLLIGVLAACMVAGVALVSKPARKRNKRRN